MTTPRLLLVDGHSLAFRAYHATRESPGFMTSTGERTNAVYIFCTMMRRLLREYAPTHVCVAFDTAAPTFRKIEYPEYKAGRKPTPEDFPPQIGFIVEAMHALGVKTTSKDGIEADDILATLARQGEDVGARVWVASGDRDAFQMITDAVTVLAPGQTMSQMREMDAQAILKKYKVTPERYPELAALTGEDADNLAGVYGVGPGVAAKWLNEFDGLDNLLERAGEIGGKRGEQLRASIDAVRRNRRLNRLLTEADLDVSFDDLTLSPRGPQAWNDVCATLEFHSLKDAMWHTVTELVGDLSDDGGEADEEPLECVLRHRDLPADELEDWLDSAGPAPVGVDVVGDDSPGHASVRAVSFAFGEEAVTIDWDEASAETKDVLEKVLGDRSRAFALIDAKAALHRLSGSGLSLNARVFDAALAAYLLVPDAREYSPEYLAKTYLQREMPSEDGADTLWADEAPSSRWRAQLAGDLVGPLSEKLEALGQFDLLADLEIPLTRVLARMEEVGIAACASVFAALHDDLTHEVTRAAEEARRIAGDPDLNLSSPKQLQRVLFDELALPPTRKIKTGYTTNAEALNQLYIDTQHPFLAYLLEHRDKIKLLQSVDGLAKAIDDSGRIHTTFQQTVAATGRLSSTAPNLQNIPARTATGREIRAGFVAGEGYEGLMTADYSQIEMRIMAHLSKDDALIAALTSGEDLHASMASLVFHIPVEEVTPQLRSRIKATSYGLAYGLSDYGLAKQLGIARGEAADLRASYFRRFSKIRDYLADVVATANREGYTTTMFGRRRYLPDLRSDSRRMREAAERAALNAPIQGSAADIMKRAMLGVDAGLREGGFASRLLLQIHDELIFEVAPGERARLEALVREAMGAAAQLSVPLSVSVGYGSTWKEAAH